MADEMIGMYTGPGVIDTQSIKEKLVDIKGGDLQGYKRQKPGIEGVIQELESAFTAHGDAAGIHPNVYQSFTAKTALLSQIRALRPVVAKLHEVLSESEVYYEDAREGDIIRMSKAILDAANHDNKPSLLAVFEKTLTYRSQYAEKAAATRRKNEEAKANDAKPSPGEQSVLSLFPGTPLAPRAEAAPR